MNAKFFDLKKEKQDRMINAALKIFALNGYKHASTDEIVKEAAVSKGLLFHYFGSKLGVYSFVYDYSVRYMALEFRMTVNAEETDLFELVRQSEEACMHVMRVYPYMQYFLYRSMSEDATEVLHAVEEKRNMLLNMYETMKNKIDYSMISNKVDGKKLCKMMYLTIKGLMVEHFQSSVPKPESLHEEIQDYLKLLKQIVYS